MAVSHTEHLDSTSQDIYGVRITPYPLFFYDVHYQEIYTKKITVQNVSQHILTIRILAPASKSFKINSIPKPKELSPGLSVSRNITFSYDTDEPEDFVLHVYVNDRLVDYHIIIKSPSAEIDFEPKIIDFGIIDAGFTSKMRKLTLRNNGSKAIPFSIDFGLAAHNLLAEPSKGAVKGNKSLHIYVTIVAFDEDVVKTEMYINAGKKFVIPVLANIIIPRLEANHPNTTENFTFLDFPPTYVGLKSIQHLCITNYSANSCMFQVLGEVGNKTVTPEDFHKISPVFQVFNVFPENGTFTAKETRVFTVTFAPKPSKNFHHSHYFCTLLLSRFTFRTVQNDDYKDTISLHSDRMPSSSCSNLKQQESLLQAATNALITPSKVPDNVSMVMGSIRKSFIRLYIYGIAEVPSVDIVPDELLLENLKIYQKEVRTLILINKSSKLPIIFHYKKVPFVDFEKYNYFLKPLQQIEINVFVTPQQLGKIKNNIEFDLMYRDPADLEEGYKAIGKHQISITFNTSVESVKQKIVLNPGLKPNYIKEVGKACSLIRFNTTIKKMKGITVDPVDIIDDNCTDLVAFPNDTQRSLRPWRSHIPCATIFSRQPRYAPPIDTDYEHTLFETEFKHTVMQYYTNYTRNGATTYKGMAKRKIRNLEYILSKHRKILCRDVQQVQPIITKLPIKEGDGFIPLGPLEMSRISTIPSVIETGPIAFNSTYHFTLVVINENNFPITIFVHPRKYSMISYSTNADRYNIDKLSRTEIEFSFHSTWPGVYAATVNLFVNDNVILPIEILADVKPRSLTLTASTIEFTPQDTTKFIEIVNRLNIAIPFYWVINASNFLIIPTHGVVPAYCTIMVQIIYILNEEGPDKVVAEFHSGDKNITEATFTAKGGTRRLVFESSEVVFENVPLNCLTIRKVFIRNMEMHTVWFHVLENSFPGEIKIYPTRSQVRPKSTVAFYVSTIFKDCISFSETINLQIVKGEVMKLLVRGNVAFPALTISPTAINMPKIPACSTSKCPITITNSSPAMLYFKFDMTDYPDFKISDSENYWDDGLKDNVVLKPNMSLKIYLHFTPADAMKLDFYLPIVLNGLLGPPLLQDIITTKTIYYLPGSTDIPSTIPCVKIRALATEPLVHFSKYSILFDLCPWNKEAIHTVKISNLQKASQDLCIATDNLASPFEIDHYCGRKVVKVERAIFISLPPKEETTLTVTFKPVKYGTYKLLLPIFYKTENVLKCHRILILKGVYIQPSIEFEKIFHVRRAFSLPNNLEPFQLPDFSGLKNIYFCRPLPLEVRSLSNKKFLFKNHLNDCTIKAFSDLHFLSITMDMDTINRISAVDYVIKIYFLCSPTKTVVYKGTVKISCSCGGHWKGVVIGCTENSFLTTYAFSEAIFPNECQHLPPLLTNSCIANPMRKEKVYAVEFFSSYPFFPLEEGLLFSFMVKTVDIAEKWIYTQGFFRRSYFPIPTGIAHVKVDKTESKSKRKPKMFIPYAQLMINIVGQQMVEYLDLKPDPEDDIERLNLLINIYKKILDFLVKQGASFTYLRAEHLLEYKYFLLYKELYFPYESNPSSITLNIINIEQYYHFAKQSWLDLFLQTYKVVCLHQLENEFHNKINEKLEMSNHPFEDFLKSTRNMPRYSNIFSVPEILLMRWLQYHFDTGKDMLFPGVQLQEREVDIFGSGFEDGLVLAAVTFVYCPYLKTYLSKIYSHPNTPEEVNHNYNILMYCWRRMQLSYNIHPSDFSHFHSIQLLMFSAYLYDVLPNMYPTEKIIFKSGLSETKTQIFKLTNKNNFPIAYKPIMIPFDNEDFTVDKDIYIIKPKRSCNIKMTYLTRYAKIVQTTLLLCGECNGYHYSKNKVISIVGIPDPSFVAMTVTYPLKLYQCTSVEFAVKSPYAKEATYELKMSYKIIDEIEKLETETCIPGVQRLCCGRFTPQNSNYHFDKNGSCTVRGIITSLRFVDLPVYLFFQNPKIGDFVVLVATKMVGNFPEEIIKVNLPKIIEFEKPMEILSIPCMNNQFWDAVKSMILNLTKGSERQFWGKILDTTPGMQFVSMLMEDVHLITRSFAKNIKGCLSSVYKVVYESQDVLLPANITILHECQPGVVTVPITVLTKRPKQFSFAMVNEDGIQRAYTVNFKYYKTEVHQCNS